MKAPVNGRARAGPGIRDEFLPFHRPTIVQEDIDAVAEVLRSGWLTSGPRVQALEKAVTGRVGCRDAVAVSSCTAALHLSLVAAGVGAGDEVITTPYTFAASGEVILYTGARPVFVDVEPETANLDPDKVEAVITPRTRAIQPVHIAGYPCRLGELAEIADRHGLVMVEDAAHALGATYRGKPVGSHSRFTCFSFYATKNLTTGEGGMVALNEEGDAEKVRVLSLHGLSRDAWKRYTSSGSWQYTIEELGFKYNLSDVAAALGLTQLERFDRDQARRGELAARYRTLLADCDAIELPPSVDGHAWHLFIVRLRPGALSIDRDEVARRLQEARIGISVHFIPLHLHPLYRKMGHREGTYPIAEDLSRRVISLPLYPGMNDEDVDYVSSVIRWIASESRR